MTTPDPDIAGPHFLGIGAQKAGTTWLHKNFSHHPGIWLPYEKELHYFDEKLDRARSMEETIRSRAAWAVRWRRQVERQLGNHGRDPSSTDLVWCARFFVSQPDDDWYRSLFTPGPGQIAGEFTPEYAVIDTDRIARVAAVNPELRVIYMVRNPIERVWSHASMTGRVTSDAAIDTGWFARAVARNRVREHTAYLANLDRWLSVFPPDRIYLGFLEDISFHPKRLLASLYRFLGLEPEGLDRAITRKVHAGGATTIPTVLAVRLAAEYHGALEALSARLGGYASVWLSIADELLRRPPSAPEIPYPFWESDLAAAAGYLPVTGEGAGSRSGPLGT
ncbi:MAG: sulfotransferase [Acidimicrobiia bacterium]